MDLRGNYEVRAGELTGTCWLPGTLDEAGIGRMESHAESWHPDAESADRIGSLHQEGMITTRLTRKVAYEGKAYYRRKLQFSSTDKEELQGYDRYFIKLERTRKCRIFMDGIQILEKQMGTLSTPYIYEVTDVIDLEQESVLEIEVDNSYEGWPVGSIKCSSAATNETQTNWNGILGEFSLYGEKKDYISSLQVYADGRQLRIRVKIDAARERKTELHFCTEILKHAVCENVILHKGENAYEFIYTDLKQDLLYWDEYEGNLYELVVYGIEIEEKKTIFGIRSIENLDGCFGLNGHRVFVRSEANCCVFAETGHMPLEVAEWTTVLQQYKDYGINLVRFHSHCPPEGAFVAADQMGIMIQPELSNWDPRNAFGEPFAKEYYELEMRQILTCLGGHPSFVALSFGNELTCLEQGQQIKEDMLELAKKLDNTRMYIGSSNGFYGMKGVGEKDDFYTSGNFYEEFIRGTNSDMRGAINEEAPNTEKNYSSVIRKIWQQKKVPVVSFEVGQFEILPDFKEIEMYQGVTIPNNIISVRDRVAKKGMLTDWEKRVEATGELAFLGYREEIEAVLRTPEMSGISLLGLQDFPGQGTALVGMLNSHLKPKEYAFSDPSRWKSFFASKVILAHMPKYTYQNTEKFSVEATLINYSKVDLQGELTIRLISTTQDMVIWENRFCGVNTKSGERSSIITEAIPLMLCHGNQKLRLLLNMNCIGGEIIQNEYAIWVFDPSEMLPEGFSLDGKEFIVYENADDPVYLTQKWEVAEALLQEGKTVFFTPQTLRENFRTAVKTQFTTDFWSVGTFPSQEGYMGCMLDHEHPVYRYFPTEDHANWHWWQLTRGFSFVTPEGTENLLTVLDSYAYLRHLSFMVETKVWQGKLLIASLGLMEKQQFPEARALLYSILQYMGSERFSPCTCSEITQLREI